MKYQLAIWLLVTAAVSGAFGVPHWDTPYRSSACILPSGDYPVGRAR